MSDSLQSRLPRVHVSHEQGLLRFLYGGGSGYSGLFWVGQIVAGSVLPLVLVLVPPLAGRAAPALLAAALVIVGVLAQLYVLIIGGQAYPLDIFPGWEVSSSFYDGVVSDSIGVVAADVSALFNIIIVAIRRQRATTCPVTYRTRLCRRSRFLGKASDF